MIGFRNTDGRYYVCGSQPYRRGMGCGPGVYVRQDQIEAEAVKGLEELMTVCTDPKGFTRQVNTELKKLWEEATNHDPRAAKHLQDVEKKIANIRHAVEDGLPDAAWANERLQELKEKREALLRQSTASGHPPQIDAQTATTYRRQMRKLLRHGKPAERKKLLRTCVHEIKLAPEQREVEITYRVPEPIMNQVVAGAGFDTEPFTFEAWEDVRIAA